jgi:hypothetical protein
MKSAEKCDKPVARINPIHSIGSKIAFTMLRAFNLTITFLKLLISSTMVKRKSNKFIGNLQKVSYPMETIKQQ